MAKIFGQLERAQLEVLAADPASPPQGLVYFNSATSRFRFYTGTVWKDLEGDLLTHTGASSGVHGITGAVVGTTDTQQLSGKSFAQSLLPEANGTRDLGTAVLTWKDAHLSGFIGMGEIATPSAPAANRYRLYFKTDGRPYYINSAGLERPVGAGGGGAGFQWTQIAGNAALEDQEFSARIFRFEAALGQELHASVQVPTSYAPGTQIQLVVAAYSPSSANTILLRAQSTLIRPGTDAFSSVANQRTSTNAALTNTVANQTRVFTMDLTDAAGLINGVAVQPGHVIKIRLFRDTDTDTAELRMIPNATDIRFG